MRALVRPSTLADPSRMCALEGLPVDAVAADLDAPETLQPALEGVEQLYHLAAYITIRPGAREALWRTNVLGTRHLLAAAKAAGVKRVVHCSSLGAVGYREGEPSTEADLPSPFEDTMDYERSKAAAETEVYRAVLAGQDVVIVNPSAVIGPHDYGPSMMGQTILDFAHGKLPAYIPGGFDFVHVDDVVAGHLLAMEQGKAGERYLLSGELVELDTLFSWLSEALGRPRPRLRLPPSVMSPIASVMDAFYRRWLPNKTPRFNRHSIRLLTSRKHASNAKAQKVLGLKPTPARQAFLDALRWHALIDAA